MLPFALISVGINNFVVFQTARLAPTAVGRELSTG
jgi:hypothetical protein